eukprot:3272620-Amphidinium_carterae.1
MDGCEQRHQVKQHGSARSAETSGRRGLEAPAGESCCGRMTWSLVRRMTLRRQTLSYPTDMGLR